MNEALSTSMRFDAFFSSAERHLPEALRLIQSLVEVNSYTANASGVAEVAQKTVTAFESLGFSAKFVPCLTPDTGPHLLLSRSGSGDPIVFVTHSDTVFPPEEEQSENFHWDERSEEGRIYGPGTIDNKGGTGLIWLLMKILLDEAPQIVEEHAWLVAANAAEEIVGDDFAQVVSVHCGGRARAILVFEGGPREDGQWHIVTSRKGRSTWRLDAIGRAAHAGSSHASGINAIDALAETLPKVAAWTSDKENRTVNIGHIGGGTVVNRVPHEAFAEWECRASDPDSLAKADAFFESLSGSASNEAQLISHRTGHTGAWPGGVDTDGLVAAWQKVGEEIDQPVRPVARGGLSDANHLWHLGPTLDGLGPSGANAHASVRSEDGLKLPEYIEVSSLVPKAVLNAAALLEWLSLSFSEMAET